MNKEFQCDNIVFQISRLISIYEIYVNLCKSEKEVMKFTNGISFAKQNQLIILLSQLYSVFDNQKKSINLSKINFSNIEVEKQKREIVNSWNEIEDSVKIIRHNIGFHTSKNIEGQKKAAEQFKKISDKPFILIEKLKYLSFLYLKNKEN